MYEVNLVTTRESRMDERRKVLSLDQTSDGQSMTLDELHLDRLSFRRDSWFMVGCA